MQAAHVYKATTETERAIYKPIAACAHTLQLEELIANAKSAQRDAQLRHVVIHEVACSYCLGRVERLEGSYLRTFALELKEQLAQTLAAFSHRFCLSRVDALKRKVQPEPPIRQIVEVLQEVMCTHDTCSSVAHVLLPSKKALLPLFLNSYQIG